MINMILQMTIPTSYSVREAILHSLEYFNGKFKKHKLKMNADLYSLIENTSSTSPTLGKKQGDTPDTPMMDRAINGGVNTSKLL